MEIDGKTVLLCDCEGTMALDAKALARACRAKDVAINRQLCRAQIDNFRAALAGGRPVLVACTQEAPLFDEIAAEALPETSVIYTNIREHAGWSSEGDKATPKIAALLAEAAVTLPPTPTVSMKSAGLCLVYGRDEAAIEAARQLRGRLDVTILLSSPSGVIPPRVVDVPIFKGTIVGASGHLGAFEIVVDDYAAMVPSSRGTLKFEAGRDGAASSCELILDLSGGPALFPSPRRREGYFNPDPRDPAAVQRAMFELTDLVGEFSKPRYVQFEAAICAHSRSRKIGCTRCLEVCPASAIRPDGDAVAIDPYLCGGCGACHSVCPTGAATYAMPPPAPLALRLRALLGTYYRAGGKRAVLLAHDVRHGADLIAALASAGDGLPADVLPFAVNEATQIGFDFLATAFAYGAASILILAPPARRQELQGLAQQVGLAEALMEGLGYGAGRCDVLVEDDPDGLAQALAGVAAAPPAPAGDYLPLGDKRSLIRLALAHLAAAAPKPAASIPLAAGAPFGAVKVNVEGCTLCLACVNVCPTGALQDNPDKPQVRFQEDACVQCGLCQATCPEKVISLEPRFNFAPEARLALLVKEEEPFACVRCGKPFGTKSTVERVLKQLADKHSMFKNERMVQSIQMCENCRVVTQFEAGGEPLAFRERPRVRTTEDYLREREAGGEGTPPTRRH